LGARRGLWVGHVCMILRRCGGDEPGGRYGTLTRSRGWLEENRVNFEVTKKRYMALLKKAFERGKEVLHRVQARFQEDLKPGVDF